MKFLLTAFPVICCIFSYAQKITKYYDADWTTTSREKAVFYADFIKEGNVYQCTSHWMSGNAIRGKSTFADTVIGKPIGTQVLYFKNGHKEDSAFYSNDKREYLYHYYANNKLAVHSYLPDNQNKAITEAFDEDGKKIKNYIFEKEAEFKGGDKAWALYLQKNISKEIAVKSKEDVTAQVQVKFTIDKDGTVINVKIFKSSSYKEIDRDALHVISGSPLWNNAVQYNNPVKAFRIQPFTYNLLKEKSK